MAIGTVARLCMWSSSVSKHGPLQGVWCTATCTGVHQANKIDSTLQTDATAVAAPHSHIQAETNLLKRRCSLICETESRLAWQIPEHP